MRWFKKIGPFKGTLRKTSTRPTGRNTYRVCVLLEKYLSFVRGVSDRRRLVFADEKPMKEVMILCEVDNQKKEEGVFQKTKLQCVTICFETLPKFLRNPLAAFDFGIVMVSLIDNLVIVWLDTGMNVCVLYIICFVFQFSNFKSNFEFLI